MPRSVDRPGTRVRARRAPWAAAAAEGGACRGRRRLSRRTRRTSSTARTRRAMSRTRTSGCVRRPLSSPPRHSPRARIRRSTVGLGRRGRGRPDALARRERPVDDARSSFPDARPLLDRLGRARPVDRSRGSFRLRDVLSLTLKLRLRTSDASLRDSGDRKRRRSTCATSRTRLRT